ncbi:MAG: tRNA pseudouridine(55) synthase TruB [Candidatus Faecousia sp.]|nr:tRNA pseudouridine(55) synthase TruB [Candidatus Faecousia sp.]
MTGIVIVDKPAGWTSQDVTARLRRVFGTRRIGHGGTLDPMATGVLPVFVGRATRGVEFFEHADKTYEAVLRLGTVTDTQDSTGTVLKKRPAAVTEAEFRDILPKFTGKIAQVPPMYSAIKVDGKKLYELARAGKEVERKPREITIFSLELLEFSGETAKIRVHCSKGTYIRTLCHDIGAALGCGACMETLRRTAAGEYTLADSVELDTLLNAERPEDYLRDVDTLFRQYPAVTLTEKQTLRCRNGNSFSIALPEGSYRAYDGQGTFLMLAKVRGGIMETVKSFFDV